jgi:4-hydroxybenzoate polyprenyltransferase
VSVLLGFSLMVQVSGVGLEQLPTIVVVFGAVNWGLFNLFEFARKTFAPEEERAHVESYSKLFRPLGASALSMSQVAIAVGALWVLSPALLAERSVLWHVVTASALAVCAGVYAIRTARGSASVLRAGAGLYIVTSYALLSYQLWHGAV